MGTLEFTKAWKFNNVVYDAVKKQTQAQKQEDQNERQKN